jgi:hypothetical protein
VSKPDRPTIDATMTAFLRPVSGANESAATITVYLTQTDETLWVATEWDRRVEIARRQRCSPSDSTVTTAYGISSPEIDFNSSACCS